MPFFWSQFPKRVTVSERRARATAAASRLGKKQKGRALDPVVVEGSRIATTVWGKAWCSNLEAYSDYANRLPRGRSYARHGAVVDLKIESGELRAQVAGTRLYQVQVTIGRLEPERWDGIVAACAGRIDSMVELLGGRLPDEVMAVVTDRERGLFPAPRQISMTCSCPDWAGMCKHVAAVLYGVGARLDRSPELLFLLRGVDHADLVHAAAVRMPTGGEVTRTLEHDDLGALFGIELHDGAAPAPKKVRRQRPAAKRVGAAKPKRRRKKPSIGTKAVSPLDELLGAIEQLGREVAPSRARREAQRPNTAMPRQGTGAAPPKRAIISHSR